MNHLIRATNKPNVTVVIPASRQPDVLMLDFWLELSTFELVSKIIFVANGQDCNTIVDTLERRFGAIENIEVISIEIGSAPRARNAGLEKTETRYVHFLDDDDRVLPNFYSHVIESWINPRVVGVAVSTDVYVDGDSDQSYRVLKHDRSVGLKSLLVDNLVGPTSGVLLKTSAVKSVGGFDEKMSARQDYDLWLRLAQTGDFRLLPVPLLVWTENRSKPSIRNSTTITRHQDAIVKLKALKCVLGLEALTYIEKRRMVANDYKYLAVMYQLAFGRKSWSYITKSFFAYPQARSTLMFMPEGFTVIARRLLVGVRQKRSRPGGYGNKERRIAIILNRFPLVKRALKYVYQGSFYLFSSYNRRKWNVETGDLVQIIVPGHENVDTFLGYYDRNPESENGNVVIHTLDRGACFIHVINEVGDLVISRPTNAWNFQQGSLPCWANGDVLIYNDCFDGKVHTVFLDLSNGQTRVLVGSFQALSPVNGRIASININLINKLRPEYGFSGIDPIFDSEDKLLAFRFPDDPEADVVFVTLDDMVRATGLHLPKGYTKVNHVVFSPSGRRVTFLLRYFEGPLKYTIQIIYDFSRSVYHVVKCSGPVSHYCWVDDETIAIWGEMSEGKQGYFLSDSKGNVVSVSAGAGEFSAGDGHPTMVPGTAFLFSDTYPDKKGRSSIYRLSLRTGVEVAFGAFHQPFRYRGEKRIDLHPRYSENSKFIYFDSGHSGHRGAYKWNVSFDNE